MVAVDSAIHWRDPDRVLADVENGWVSMAKASVVYGVVLMPQNGASGGACVDREATAALR